jgi:hypothetical protein
MCNKIISKSLQNPAMFFLSPKIRGKSPQTCTLISNRSYLSPQKTKIEGTSPKNKLQQGSTRAPKFERLLKAPPPLIPRGLVPSPQTTVVVVPLLDRIRNRTTPAPSALDAVLPPPLSPAWFPSHEPLPQCGSLARSPTLPLLSSKVPTRCLLLLG